MFDKIKRKILKTYLLARLEELEQFSLANKCWKANADVAIVLSDLLLANTSLIENLDGHSILQGKIVDSPYINLSELELYVSDFLKQSRPFILGETSSRPKVISEAGSTQRSVDMVKFIEFHNGGFIGALERIKVLSLSVKDTMNKANSARGSYLEDMMSPIFHVLLGLIEEIYEVL